MTNTTFPLQLTPRGNPHEYSGRGEWCDRRQDFPGDACRETAPPASLDISPQVFIIRSDADVKTARREARAMAESLGFSSIDATLIATVISELARNMLFYGNGGEIGWYAQNSEPAALVITACSDGPEIGGIGAALRAMDELSIASEFRIGTTVTLKKYRPRAANAFLPPPADVA